LAQNLSVIQLRNINLPFKKLSKKRVLKVNTRELTLLTHARAARIIKKNVDVSLRASEMYRGDFELISWNLKQTFYYATKVKL